LQATAELLFVDLVGFTAASEGRDAEDTRERLHATPWLERVDAPGLRARVGSVVG
jgi:hypothetical protein